MIKTDEIPTFFREIRRVLKPGGRCCIIAMSAKKKSVMMKLYSAARLVFPKTFSCRPIYAEIFLKLFNFKIKKKKSITLMGIPVEVAVGIKN